MIKALVAAVLLVVLSACGSGADPTAKPAAPDKPLPYAPPPPPMQEEGGACTADVHQCPDGSYVSRNAARGCAFDPCPGARNP